MTSTQYQALRQALLPDLPPGILAALRPDRAVISEPWTKEHLVSVGIKEPWRTRLLDPAGETAVDDVLGVCRRDSIAWAAWGDPDYPKRLQTCWDAPAVLFWRGVLPANPARVLGVVGTRRASSYGMAAVRSTLQGLGHLDLPIVSGLAYGVDAMAHQVALELGLPTWAVLAAGVDACYPKGNTALFYQVLDRGGALISEFPPGTEAMAHRFPRRNRVLAGLVDALWVVESAVKGGSMITADEAISYHRDVFALPGRVDHPVSAGCHALIRRSQAGLITGAADLLRAMGWPKRGTGFGRRPPPGASWEPLIPILSGKEPLDANALGEALAWEPKRVGQVLLEAELSGWVIRLPGGRYALVP